VQELHRYRSTFFTFGTFLIAGYLPEKPKVILLFDYSPQLDLHVFTTSLVKTLSVLHDCRLQLGAAVKVLEKL